MVLVSLSYHYHRATYSCFHSHVTAIVEARVIIKLSVVGGLSYAPSLTQ